MAATPWVPTVKKIKDGETVESATVNPPLDQLIQRDQHLYEKFNELLGKSVLLAFDQPIHPAESLSTGLSVVYFKEDVNGTGLAKAVTGFSSMNYRSMYAPTDSNFTFGITHTLNSSYTKADMYIHGLCELRYDLDDPVYGLVEQEPSSPETFKVGPYYLSRKYPGKITNNPAGIPVYVGYALSKRSFMLQPSVDEFSQFFVNYRFNILDRPAGTPTLSGGGIWSLPAVSPTRLGWVAADPSVLPGFAIPLGAKFFYYIPGGAYTQDAASLTYNEKIEASELKAALPPIPANFVQISVNGVMQRLRDDYTPDGIYSVDQYGVWWYDDTDGKQPWASDLASGVWTPDSWPTVKGSPELRPRTFISFSKFNPALRTQLVSSLRPMNESSSFLKFYSKENPTVEAFTGDLYAKIAPEFTRLGSTVSSAFPATQTATYTAGQAISDIAFDEASGKFKVGVTPVVAQLTGDGNITVSNQGAGKYQLSFRDQGITGFVDSIEPVNATLEFLGLNSYIKLPYSTASTTPYALIAKIILPAGCPVGNDLALTLHLFGATSTTGTVAFDFQYAVSKVNGVLTASSSAPVVATFDLPSPYTKNTNIKLTAGNLVIPSSAFAQDSIVNLKLKRNASAGSYTGDVGILGIYWSI